ncbi:hypothetical protein ACFQ61_05625 [Streptomyces sp. NPDC056500]|uniref:TY-Chap domain-containing protein n=1 Tax=Streptomyces sp. NPDC056500 TaxID=3345840 RepID=UPI0036A581D6
MKNTIPRGNWLDDDVFRELVREIILLRLGGWSLEEFERAGAVLGWELGEPSEVAGQVWRRFLPRRGPWGGNGTVIAGLSEPGRIHTLRVPVVDLPPGDVWTASDLVRAAWWVMEEELGPPTLWGGRVGPWMLWRRPGGSLVVHSHHSGRVNLELVHTGPDSDAATHGGSRCSWRAADPAHLPAAPAGPHEPTTGWDRIQERLFQALRALTHDTPFLPARFILHLASAHDPHRFVQCWNDGSELVIEATGYLHHPELAAPARLADSGWNLTQPVWQRRFPQAARDWGSSRTAACMLVEELKNLGTDPAHLVHSGTVTGRGRAFHLDLPETGVRRGRP